MMAGTKILHVMRQAQFCPMHCNSFNSMTSQLPLSEVQSSPMKYSQEPSSSYQMQTLFQTPTSQQWVNAVHLPTCQPQLTNFTKDLCSATDYFCMDDISDHAVVFKSMSEIDTGNVCAKYDILRGTQSQ